MTSTIAPCGMNCELCYSYQNLKKACPGCRHEVKGIRKSCRNCVILLCGKKKDYCYECPIFPCKRLKELDARYRFKYGMSLLENLASIKEGGETALLLEQKEKYTCPVCGKLRTVHYDYCIHCKQQNKRNSLSLSPKSNRLPIMEPFALKDKDTFPAPEVLRATLKDSYAVFQQLEENLEDTGISVQWNYYKDGKAWMGKLLLKKKNLGWLHIYDGYFTTTCFFMEKHLHAICLSDIDKESITKFESKINTSGKLIPMTITLRNESQLKEALTVISFKRKLK